MNNGCLMMGLAEKQSLGKGTKSCFGYPIHVMSFSGTCTGSDSVIYAIYINRFSKD